MVLQRALPAWTVSLGLHGAALLLLAMLTFEIRGLDPELVIESFLPVEERIQQEFEQRLDTQVDPAETLNFQQGGVVAEAIGGSNAPAMKAVDPQQIEDRPTVAANVNEIALPGVDEISTDLGNLQVSGEVGALVDGYDMALDQMTKELIRLMRLQKVTVVWLFDESNSMKDDQQAIKGRFRRIYEELRLFQDENERKEPRKGTPILLTAIASFGEKIHYHLPQPTDALPRILQAIDQVPIDPSGVENTCQAVLDVLKTYRNAVTARRKLVVVVITDESGDDGSSIEEAVDAARRLNAPVYVMGREAVFGSLYAHVGWTHPQTGQFFRLPVRRGPESPYFEQLQFDGITRRYDAHMSGFGPYELVRMARDTGGIFFMLPDEETDIIDFDARRYEAFDLREYQPSLLPRVVYEKERAASPFRSAVVQAAMLLNPYDPRLAGLEVAPAEWYPLDVSNYGPRVAARNRSNLATLQAMNKAQETLEAVRRLRGNEPSPRWRAHFDLMSGQLLAYRYRMVQYILGLDQFAENPGARIRSARSNHWSVHFGGGELLRPTPAEEKLLGATHEELEQLRNGAIKQLQRVGEIHPKTPWASRAAWELRRDFGVHFAETFIDPNPPPPRPGPAPPAPAPPPKL